MRVNAFHQAFRLWLILKPSRRTEVLSAIILIILSALFEVVSIVSVIPFFALLSGQTLSSSQLNELPSYVSRIISTMPFSTQLTSAAILFASTAIISSIFKIATQSKTIRLASNIGSEIGTDLYRDIIHRPYIFHVSTNSSQILSLFTNQVRDSIEFLTSLFNIITGSVSALIVTVGLIVFSPESTLLIFTFLVIAYLSIFSLIKRPLLESGRRQVGDETRLLKVIQESIGGIREVILRNNYDYHQNLYSHAEHRLRKDRGTTKILTIVPRFLIESAGLTGISLLVILLVLNQKSSLSILTTVATLTYGIQRILPSVQQVYASWSQVLALHQSLEQLLYYFNDPRTSNAIEPKAVGHSCALTFSELKFVNVEFTYPASSGPTLSEVNVTIRKGDRIGIIGTTGSGKSTFVDMATALIAPSKGSIYLNNSLLDVTNATQWRLRIGHVPQRIYLADTTIMSNIAGDTDNPIISRVIQSSKRASIHNFITSLPDGYDTIVGERGVRLSGGQLQRVAIARALYNDPQVLVFDEATSALDCETENSIIDTMSSFSPDITVIVVAHRYSTIANCNRILHVQNGLITEIDKTQLDKLSP